MKKLGLVSLLALAGAHTAHAQSTNISPDTAAGASLGTAVNQSANIYTIDGGTTAGTNLFHSFSTFDVGAGDVAQWVYSAGDPSSITSVINRITGGNPSSILGVLDSTALPNADFYFINPAGIVFGGDSVVNVPAAAHFSTASELRFASGEVFSIATPSGSTLSVAAPQSFGFLGNEGDIVHDANHYSTYEPFLPGAGALTFSAANLTMLNALIGAGEIALTAVGAEAADVPVDGLDRQQSYGGSITIVNSWLELTGCYDCYSYSGHIVLNAGTILIDGTGIVAELYSPDESGDTSFIELVARDSVTLSGYSYVLVGGHGARDAGSVLIEAGGDVDLITSTITTYAWGTGDAGAIDVRGANVRVSGGEVGSITHSTGNGGSVSISAVDQLIIENVAWILTDATDSGDAGALTLIAPEIIISDSLVSSDSSGSGNAGSVAINAEGALTAINSTISSSTFGDGQGGSVLVSAGGMLHMDDSWIMSVSWTASGAGDVSVVAGDALLTNGSVISSDAFVDGDAGDISVAIIGHLQLEGGSVISSSAGDRLVGSGESSEGETSAEILGDGVSIASSPPPPPPPGPPPTLGGNAGTVGVSAGSLSMSGGSAISSRSYAGGDGGQVMISAGAIALSGSSITTDANGAGDAGDVNVTAGSLILDQASKISSAATWENGGSSGRIQVSTEDLVLSGGSVISTTSASTNPAGQVEIFADRFFLNGINSAVESENFNAIGGDAGSILIHSNAVSITEGARVSTNSLTGAAGNITFDMSQGSILTLSGAERPGIIETSSGPGAGGVIIIASPLAIISHGGVISALGESGGANVQIDANYFIASSDRMNVVEVDGTLTFSNAIYDVSAGTADADLSMIDASGVLQGQCSNVRATGQVSQLNMRPSGPYGSASWPSLQLLNSEPVAAQAVIGGCQ